MVDEIIAEFLAEKTSLTEGVDLFLDSLDTDDFEGVVVREIVNGGNTDFDDYAITILCIFKNSNTSKTTAKTIHNLLKGKTGLLSTGWSVVGRPSTIYYGEDPLKRTIYAVIVNVSYNEEEEIEEIEEIEE
jgi:hypothetical protein